MPMAGSEMVATLDLGYGDRPAPFGFWTRTEHGWVVIAVSDPHKSIAESRYQACRPPKSERPAQLSGDMIISLSSYPSTGQVRKLRSAFPPTAERSRTTCVETSGDVAEFLLPEMKTELRYEEALSPRNSLTSDSPTEERQAQYDRIGWWKGPFAAPQARKSVREFWVDQGAKGAEWLVDRISTETHVEILDGVAGVLKAIGPAAIEPIVRKLEGKPTRDQAEVLLKSLGWIEARRDVTAIGPETRRVLCKTLERYLADKDADIRAAACAASRLLSRSEAVELLERRRAVERDSDVLEAIEDALCD